VDQVSLATAAVMGVLLAVTAGGLIRGIAANLSQGQQVRRDLGERLGRLPLVRVLRLRGADPTGYLHQRPVHEIERQLRVCAGCSAVHRCERALRQGAAADEFRFCPNYRALTSPD